jgi:4'-phosphopantetheinyl transferase
MRWENSIPKNDLFEGDVHLWRVGLDMPDAALRSVSETLSEEERKRGQRFRFPILQRRFAAGRGALRTILGKYLSVDPGRLVFSYNPHGKPSLPDSATDIQFNVSHSHDLMIAAICRKWAIGVDIEKEENRFDTLEIAARFFCERERRELAELNGEERLKAFFQLWTAKEAIVKATALGLSLELTKFEIGLKPLRLCPSKQAAEIPWHLVAFSPGENCAGALAVAEEPVRLVYRHLHLP